jgi:hypothetical protein
MTRLPDFEYEDSLRLVDGGTDSKATTNWSCELELIRREEDSDCTMKTR